MLSPTICSRILSRNIIIQVSLRPQPVYLLQIDLTLIRGWGEFPKDRDQLACQRGQPGIFGPLHEELCGSAHDQASRVRKQ